MAKKGGRMGNREEKKKKEQETKRRRQATRGGRTRATAHHRGAGGRDCRACKGKISAGAEARHEVRDPQTGVLVHPCQPGLCPHCRRPMKLGEVLRDHGNCGRLSKLARVIPPPSEAVVVVMETVEEAPAPTITPPASIICERCKKPVAPGEGSHFRLKQRVNARPGVMDKKWLCHAPSPPKPIAPSPPKPVAAPSAKVGKWFKKGELWDCSSCHKIDISYRDATCPSGCGGTRPPF